MDQKPCLSVAFIGHRGCGKSTLAGKLIYQLKSSQGILDNSYVESMKSLPASFVVDRLKEEREKCETINFSLTALESEKYEYTICNVPGRYDLLKNVIRGTSQADAAVIVVFEAGMSAEGQTKWHTIIAFAFGIKQYIVCITKTDEKDANFSEDRFKEIKTRVSECVKKIGIFPDKIQFIPVSGLSNENLIEKSSRFDWYKGPTLFEAMENLSIPKRLSDKPLRMPIQQVQKVKGAGTVPMGKVQSGTMKLNSIIHFDVSNISTEVRSIEYNHKNIQEAVAGTDIGFNIKGVNTREVRPGHVLGDAKLDPPYLCKEFLAQVIILNHPTQVKEGYTPIISIHTANVACRFEEIDKLDRATGEYPANLRKVLRNGESGVVRIRPLKKVCVESFQEFPHLGRFVIRDLSRVIGVGVVKSVTERSKH